jgi:hypothetical protein
MKRTRNVTALIGCALGLSGLLGCDTGAPDASGEDTTSVEQPLFISICNFHPVGATASSTRAGTNNVPANAIDTNQGSRWESALANDQSITVDLGRVLPIYRVEINWEGAYAKTYNIEVSNTANGTFNPVLKNVAGTGAGWVELDIPTNVSARYVRMHGLTRATQYGFSLFTFTVMTGDVSCPSIDNDHDGYGAPGSACGFCPANPPPATDCNDHLATVNPGVTGFFNKPWTDGSTSSWDWNCSGHVEEFNYPYPIAACLDASGNETSDCSKCVYSFVDIGTDQPAECGKVRCNLGGQYTLTCH